MAKELVRETMPHVLALAVLFLILLASRWRRVTRWELFLVLFTLSFGFMLSFCNIPLFRYNLPVIVILHLMAALTVVRLANLFSIRTGWIVVAVALVLMIPLQLRRCLNYLDQFANDSRTRLRSFIAHQLPDASVIVADEFAIPGNDDDPHLTGEERRPPCTLYSGFWAADLGDLESLQRRGIDYVAVSELAYGRFFYPEVRPVANDPSYAVRRRFYDELFKKGELVWSSDPVPPTYSFVNPAVRLYRLRKWMRGESP